ncbi:MAG: hypothetical protein K2J70_03095 [Muribaculaceae bacterium]|nr:hypothetical protein [Muribaculaceae bacterium]
MKKFYCALAAAAIALTANAADYYLIGGFNGWTLKDAKRKFVEKSATEYELNYDGTLTSGFKINDGTWDDASADQNFGSNGNKLEIGVAYTMTTGKSSGNIEIEGAIENPTLVLNVSDPSAPTLLIKGASTEVEYGYILWGTFSDGATWEGIELKEESGKFVADANVAKCEFGIKEVVAGTENQVRWLSSAGAAGVTLGTAMPLQVEGSNFSLPAGDYSFSLDVAAMTLTVTNNGGDTPNPPTPPVSDAKDLYLVGDISGWDQTALPFTRVDNVYTIELEDGLTGKWKITDGKGWAYNFGAGAEQPTSGVEVDAYFDGADFESAFSGKTTVVFTLVEGSDVKDSSIPSKVKVTSEAVAEPWPVEEWYVSVQGPFNKWVGEGVHPNAEGVAEISDLALNEAGFKVKVYNGLADSWYCNGEALALNTPTVVEGDVDTLMTVAGLVAGDKYKVTFNVTDGTITVNTISGVEAISVSNGEAVYFNLQGMKVENPVNGVFVKVLDGKAVKVVK